MSRARFFIGRKKPYTERGIRRAKCARCGAAALFQWQVCANGNRWQGLCKRCDVALNRLALQFMRHPHADTLLGIYAGLAIMDTRGRRYD